TSYYLYIARLRSSSHHSMPLGGFRLHDLHKKQMKERGCRGPSDYDQSSVAVGVAREKWAQFLSTIETQDTPGRAFGLTPEADTCPAAGPSEIGFNHGKETAPLPGPSPVPAIPSPPVSMPGRWSRSSSASSGQSWRTATPSLPTSTSPRLGQKPGYGVLGLGSVLHLPDYVFDKSSIIFGQLLHGDHPFGHPIVVSGKWVEGGVEYVKMRICTTFVFGPVEGLGKYAQRLVRSDLSGSRVLIQDSCFWRTMGTTSLMIAALLLHAGVEGEEAVIEDFLHEQVVVVANDEEMALND
ncbi:hypothetical protein IAQ61_000355, partial [Plenodomus lingam]|uniref:uncharacterized protein n=1 Tax=Leptosphaeria maculans TaxID=5022 RepID=UPI0033235D7B